MNVGARRTISIFSREGAKAQRIYFREILLFLLHLNCVFLRLCVHQNGDPRNVPAFLYPTRFLLMTILPAILLAGCYHPTPKEAFNDIKALEGKWVSTGTTLFNENWKVVSDTLMTGTGFSLNGGDTVFQERLKIFRTGENIWYAAQPNPEKEYVLFRLTKAGYRHWTFENPVNDYPGIIVYLLKKDTLLETRATNIRGNKEVVFTFKKISQ